MKKRMTLEDHLQCALYVRAMNECGMRTHSLIDNLPKKSKPARTITKINNLITDLKSELEDEWFDGVSDKVGDEIHDKYGFFYYDSSREENNAKIIDGFLTAAMALWSKRREESKANGGEV